MSSLTGGRSGDVCGSIVIPAHNEEAVIGRCLDSLFDGTPPGTFEVVVACNGCTDATASIVSRGPWPVAVLDLKEASKAAALRAAESATTVFPRLYVDADVTISATAARAVLGRLAQPGALAARPPLTYDTDGAPATVRWFLAARRRTPRLMSALWGAGVYGLSEDGRSRFGRFPDVVADDLFVDRCFELDEIEVVDTEPVVVTSPRRMGGLWSVLRRTYTSNGDPSLGSKTWRPGPGRTLLDVLATSRKGPSAARDAGWYAIVVTAARLWARVRPPAKGSWSRDHSSRTVSAPPTTQHLFDLDFANHADIDEVANIILRDAAMPAPPSDDGRLPVVVTPNVDYLVTMSDDSHPDAIDVVRRARYVLPDGQPIVWASRLLGRPLAARLPGASLFPVLWRRIIDEQRSVHVVAPSDEVARRLQAEYPAATVTVPPMFAADDAAALASLADACDEIAATRQPQMILIGISYPKQALLAAALLERAARRHTDPPLVLLLGGAFEMHVRLRRRAPRWAQRAGLEWLVRFLQEPRRLFRRYFITDTRFVGIVVGEWWRNRATTPDPHR